MLTILLVVLCIVLLLTLGWDALSCLFLWASRIKVGRWDDRGEWRAAVQKKARKWLIHTPIVPISDNKRYQVLDVLKGQYRSNRIQSWQVGGLLLGLESDDARHYLRRHPVSFDPNPFTPDIALYAYALKTKGVLPVSEEEKIRIFLERSYQEGTVPYCAERADLRYVDTIGMLCPLLYSIGLDSLADRQIAEFDRALCECGLPFHALDTATELPLGARDWGRGCGWYMLGLISSETNKDRILSFAAELLSLQRPDGTFGSFLLDRRSHVDSSATVLAGLLFVSAYKYSGDSCFLTAAGNAERALMKMTRRDGTVDYAQGDTKGVGVYSSNFDRMPFVQGMTLLLGREIDSLVKVV